MYLEKRRQLYYAVLTIPILARKTLDKSRFIKSTGSGDKRDAQHLANQYVAGWTVLIKNSLGSSESLRLLKAIQWREEIEKTESDIQRKSLEHLLMDETEVVSKQDGYLSAKMFYGIATGKQTPTVLHFGAWKSQLTLEPKTIDQMVRDVKLLVDQFNTIESITPTSALKWFDTLATEGRSSSSRVRMLKGCRNFWSYLKTRLLVPAESNPFPKISARAKGKAARKVKANVAYTPEQVVMFWHEALNQTRYGQPHRDQQLADLIMIAAYTGNRIEEVCSLKLLNVTENTIKFVDTKTESGDREVPIHSKLIPIINRLKSSSTDGYLMTELTTNKFGDRAGAMGKRFGILKTKLGFQKRLHTMHSFRSTLITMLERAGVPVNIAADIAGHEKTNITYGLYSGGTSIEMMSEALEKVSYPFTAEQELHNQPLTPLIT
jgi:integrase